MKIIHLKQQCIVENCYSIRADSIEHARERWKNMDENLEIEYHGCEILRAIAEPYDMQVE